MHWVKAYTNQDIDKKNSDIKKPICVICTRHFRVILQTCTKSSQTELEAT